MTYPKRMKWSLGYAGALAVVLLNHVCFSFADSEKYQKAIVKDFETIADVNLEFLFTNPKLNWGTDPFYKKPGYLVSSRREEKFSLGGIAYNEENPIAIVNGTAVMLDDFIGNRRVAEIGSNYVILERGDSLIEITMPPIEEDFNE